MRAASRDDTESRKCLYSKSVRLMVSKDGLKLLHHATHESLSLRTPAISNVASRRAKVPRCFAASAGEAGSGGENTELPGCPELGSPEPNSCECSGTMDRTSSNCGFHFASRVHPCVSPRRTSRGDVQVAGASDRRHGYAAGMMCWHLRQSAAIPLREIARYCLHGVPANYNHLRE